MNSDSFDANSNKCLRQFSDGRSWRMLRKRQIILTNERAADGPHGRILSLVVAQHAAPVLPFTFMADIQPVASEAD